MINLAPFSVGPGVALWEKGKLLTHHSIFMGSSHSESLIKPYRLRMGFLDGENDEMKYEVIMAVRSSRESSQQWNQNNICKYDLFAGLCCCHTDDVRTSAQLKGQLKKAQKGLFQMASAEINYFIWSCSRSHIIGLPLSRCFCFLSLPTVLCRCPDHLR